VETVLDAFYERIAEGKEASLLSTDFAKAYDYLNRDVIIKVLMDIKAPSQIVELAKKIFQDANIYFHANGLTRIIRSWTGVKQGCPISPAIFCLVFDLLVDRL